jgi:hypothetical protein
MKQIILLISLFLLVFECVAQRNIYTENFDNQWITKTSWFLPTEQASTQERQAYQARLLSHAKHLVTISKHNKQDRAFLQKIFRKTHKKFLGKYQKNTPFAHIFRTGEYDCVASTAMFALMLEYTGFTYQIYETVNHVYLKVQTEKGVVLLETTNATGGFMKFAGEIAKTEKDYGTSTRIDLKALAGLQLYNQALFAMQNENIVEGKHLLKKAKMLYFDSERIERLQFLATKYPSR